MSGNSVIFLIIFVIVVAILYFLNIKKEMFKGEICYKTYIPKTNEEIVGAFKESKADYKAFLTNTPETYSVEKDFSPEALNFYIGINSR